MSTFLLLLMSLSSPYQTAPRVVVAYSGEATWESSLYSALGEKGLVLFILPADRGNLELLEWARRNQMDLIVSVNISVSAGNASVRFTLTEAVSGDKLGDGTWTAQTPDARILASSFWVPLVRSLDENIGRMQGAQVKMKALPGTVITGLAEEAVTVGENSEASFPLRVPGVYSFRAAHPERVPIQSTVAALQNGLVVELDQKPLRQWTMEAGLIMGQYPTLTGKWHFYSDRMYASVGLQQYILGWILSTEGYGEYADEPPDASFPLLIPFLGYGYYFTDSDVFLRPFVGLELGPRIWLPKGLGLRLDSMGFLQFTYQAGAEWNFASNLALTVQFRIHHYIGPSEYAEYAENKNRLSVVGTPIGIFQIPILYGGLTWSF